MVQFSIISIRFNTIKLRQNFLLVHKQTCLNKNLKYKEENTQRLPCLYEMQMNCASISMHNKRKHTDE